MRNKIQLLFILLTIIVISFPSICFSELKTFEGEYCEIYMGDMNHKKELDEFRNSIRRMSIENGLRKLDKMSKMDYLVIFYKDWCLDQIISQYLEKVIVVSHTEKGRKICEKVKITSDPEVINRYLEENYLCRNTFSFDFPEVSENDDIDNVLIKKNDKINIGLIIETKIPNIDVSKREQLENEEERWFHIMIERNKDKYKVVDRRHLGKVLEEQKLSSSGITDSETVKLGKILNLDIIVLRLIYENSNVTKVLKVDTGEVLLFKTYSNEDMKTDSEQFKFPDPPDKRWVYFMSGENKSRHYYDSQTVVYPTKNIIRVWSKIQFVEGMEKDESMKRYKEMDAYYEINCLQRELRIIDGKEWYWDGKTTSSDEPTQWLNIKPDSAVDYLSNKMCNNLKVKINKKSDKKK